MISNLMEDACQTGDKYGDIYLGRPELEGQFRKAAQFIGVTLILLDDDE